MRKFTLDQKVLDLAAARAEQSPAYRFWGRKSPADHKRTPILDKAPKTQVENGVAHMRIYEPIDSWGGPWGISAVEFLDALDELSGDVTHINLRINSPGGEVFEAVAILNALRNHSATVTAYVDGLAASAASFIAAGADELVMGKNTEFMIHEAWGIVIGNAADMHKMGDLLDHLSSNVASIYAEKAGGDVADWRQAMLDETWYGAQEAVDAGLADRIEGDESADTSPADGFDLTQFKHAGRADAPSPAARDKAPVPDLTETQVRAQRIQERRHAQLAARVTA